MRHSKVILTLVLAGVLIVSITEARQKNVGAYLSGAKIAIVEDRPYEALTLFDTLAMFYGPHAEALSRRSQVYVDLMEDAAGADAKKPFVEALVTYIDSLRMCCENEDIEKKYRKNCKKYITLGDSTKVKYWREFYNLGVAQLQNIEELAEDLKTETDSSTRAYIENDIMANIDSVQGNMALAITLDPGDHRPYVAIGNAWERKGDYNKAIEWMLEGLEKAKDRSGLLLPIAYNHIKLDQYCEAVPYYKEYCDAHPKDVSNLVNLSICYNNCGLFDSAMMVYRQTLKLDPENLNALVNGGRYFMMEAQEMSDSSAYYRSVDDPETAEAWGAKRTEMFDSARAYYEAAFELNPDNAIIAEQYAFACALLEDCGSAIVGYEKVAELRPEDANNWTMLGDCYLRLARFDDAQRAYESVVELDPDKLKIWENLQALYKQLGLATKEAEAAAKIEELSN